MAVKAKRKTVSRRGKRTNPDPVFENCESMTGSEFQALKRRATDYYRLEYKASDLYADYYKWLANNGYSKDQIKHIKKFGQEIGIASVYSRCINTGMPDYHEAEAEYWESLPGTSGKLYPISIFLHKKAETILAKVSTVIDDDEEESKPEVKKPNIQDHLREKTYKTMGELEDLWDRYIESGSKEIKEKPFNIIHNSNLSPQFINLIVDHWEQVKAELVELQAGTCEQLNEGYSHWGKIQVRNNIRFCEQVISDCGSYTQLKKSNRAPRKRKPVSPEKLTRGFKYLKEDTALGIKSVKVTELVEASEAWIYDTKKRKLIYVVADSYTKTFSVKGASLIGIDTTKTVQKTLRKPPEQLKEFMKLSVPKRRKFFQDLKSVEIKYTGRSNENLLLLAIR